MRSVLVDGEKERSAMRRHIELLSSHKMQLEEEALCTCVPGVFVITIIYYIFLL